MPTSCASAATSRSPHGALSDAERDDWAWASEAAARDVAEGRAEQAIVCCWTGTGASIAANKVPGIRAALCRDAQTAEGARRWNDANALALSLRATSEAELGEILDAWFAGGPSAEADDRANVAHLAEIERLRRGCRRSADVRLLPDPGETTVAEQLAGSTRASSPTTSAPTSRSTSSPPSTAAPRSTAARGRSARTPTRRCCSACAPASDAVMIGAGTMRAERYGRMVSDPDLRACRERRGLATTRSR